MRVTIKNANIVIPHKDLIFNRSSIIEPHKTPDSCLVWYQIKDMLMIFYHF